jgi:acyl carrier protein
MSDQLIVERLRALMLEHLHVEVPSADTDLLDSGLLDSLQLVDLLLLIEQQFGHRIAIEAIDLENLRSLTRIAELLGTPAAASAGAGTAGGRKADSEPAHGSSAAARRGTSPRG